MNLNHKTPKVRYYWIVVFLFLPFTASAQLDTLYMSKDFLDTVSKEDAVYKRVIKKEGLFTHRQDFYLNGTLKTYAIIHADSQRMTGDVEEYYESGTLKSKEHYKSGEPDGEWLQYYDGNQLWAIQHFKDGKLHGIMKSYYPNAKLKRDAVYNDGQLVSGQMYDVKGNKIVFTPFKVMPEAAFGLTEFLASNLRYPPKARRRGLQGRVNVLFKVNEQGVIQDVRVVRSLHPLLDEEAIRVVSSMPRWKPGKEDDVPVEVHFTQPILFRIEK